MRPSIRSRLIALVRGQWAGLLALFLVVAGGTAYAANTIGSSDIINGQVKSPDIGTGQVQSVDVRDDELTGADIKNQTGVDTCVASTRLGSLCVRAENLGRPFLQARTHCANLDMRVPTIGEALQLAVTHDIPLVGETEEFWTD